MSFTKNFQISGITCPACVKLITKRFNTLPGVENVETNGDGQAKIFSSIEISSADVINKLADTDYNIVAK